MLTFFSGHSNSMLKVNMFYKPFFECKYATYKNLYLALYVVPYCLVLRIHHTYTNVKPVMYDSCTRYE